MDAILSLLGLDFYRDKTARVAGALDDAYIDGPDGQQRRYRKNPKTGRWEEIGPDGRPVKPGTGTGTTKPGTTTNYLELLNLVVIRFLGIKRSTPCPDGE